MTPKESQREVEIICDAVERGRTNDACNVLRRIEFQGWKQGMTDAATIATFEGVNEIIKKRDKTTTV